MILWTGNLLVANGIETLTFMDFDRLSQDAAIFWAFFHLTRVLFTAEVVTWAITIFGFSAAGLGSSTLPKWLAWLGFVSAGAGLLSGVFIVPLMDGAWSEIFIAVAALTGMVWFLSASLVLSRK